MTVCLCGNMNQDILFFLERFPDFHEKVVTRYYFIGQGGSAANTAWWLSKMGVGTKMVGCVGRDSLGDDAIEGLKEAGIDTSGVSRSCKRTGLATIISCGQDKRMIKVSGANDDISFKAENFADAEHIHLSSLGEAVTGKIIRFAEENGIPVSWDPSGSIMGDVLDKVDYLFINEDDMERNSKLIENNPPKNTIITLNNGGCVINGSIKVDSFGIDALDTTGAGDSFDAGFIYGLINGMELGDCGKLGVACASENIRMVGSREGFRGLKEIKKIMDGKP